MKNHSTFLHPLGWAGVLCAALLLALAPFKAQADISVEIMCSPSVVVMKSFASGDWMTVHTDLAYSSVDTASVELDVNGAASLGVVATKADDCGNLVAKFSLTELKGLVAPPSATLTLTGLTKDGVAFAGSDTVAVRAGK
ncbi:MAG: hypothetical protein KA118_09830 [Verrucomicrobia bacterium]|nr:hypothetical protein [Verrucomicrobiota bacterium]